MFEFIHDIIEAWILQGASGKLSGLKRRLIQAHLKGCPRCRAFTLDLVEFSHGSTPDLPGAALGQAESDEFHAGVMAAFQRQLISERPAAPTLVFLPSSGPAIRPGFLKALGVAVLILAALVTLSYPYRHGDAAGDSAQANFESGRAAALALSPTATLSGAHP